MTHLSLDADRGFRESRAEGEVQAVFLGLGPDGTLGATKASVKIIGEGTDVWAQGYFVDDSKQSGSVTVSRLRFGPELIRSTYLVDDADFVACHQFGSVARMPVLARARRGATFLLNRANRLQGRTAGLPALTRAPGQPYRRSDHRGKEFGMLVLAPRRARMLARRAGLAAPTRESGER